MALFMKQQYNTKILHILAACILHAVALPDGAKEKYRFVQDSCARYHMIYSI